MQLVPGWLQLHVLLQLHGDQIFNRFSSVQVQWLNPWNSWSTLQTISPVTMAGCYLPMGPTSTCNATLTVSIDTTMMLHRDGVTPVDGVVSLRVQATTAQTSDCPTIFNSSLPALVFDPVLNATVPGTRRVTVFDAECTARTAGFEAPIIVNNGGTWNGILPSVPPRVRGLSFISLPWCAGQARPALSMPDTRDSEHFLHDSIRVKILSAVFLLCFVPTRF